MENCGSCKDANGSNSIDGISIIKCTYEIQENGYVQIINNRNENIINEDIETKIKILNDGKKEKLVFKKEFSNKGIYTINFIVEENLKNMNYMFKDCTSLKKIEFSSVDTSHVIKMIGMFAGCKEIEYIDLYNFNTLNLTDMGWMFYQCHKLKEIKGLNFFNTINVNRLSISIYYSL